MANLISGDPDDMDEYRENAPERYDNNDDDDDDEPPFSGTGALYIRFTNLLFILPKHFN
jgi:hypothetical protein